MIGKFFTDRGKIRNHNEDSGGIYHNRYGQFLAIIADGMGGHKAGDVASQMATTLIKEKWEQSNQLQTPDEIEIWLRDSIQEMNKALFEYASNNEECQGMGTTIVIAICTDEFITVAHVGDSRCYLVNENGFNQLTEDHSLVNALVQSGQITKEDAQHHPRKNVVLKAVGTEEYVESDIRSLEWDSGNILLLCTDGLTDKLTDDELGERIQRQQDMEEKGQQLIHLANELGGEDNISLILVQYDVPQEEGEIPC
ncbi:Stp1/IreP family PP2C-type Ser/Thr phosphatase [Virgibacillus sp. FSP13]